MMFPFLSGHLTEHSIPSDFYEGEGEEGLFFHLKNVQCISCILSVLLSPFLTPFHFVSLKCLTGKRKQGHLLLSVLI